MLISAIIFFILAAVSLVVGASLWVDDRSSRLAYLLFVVSSILAMLGVAAVSKIG